VQLQLLHVPAVDADDDIEFDERLPARLRRHSPTHFTPVEVARHAAALLAPNQGDHVLDVGAGAGKFCLVAAGTRPQATFVGVELRGHLVDVATELAAESKLSNVRFINGDAFEIDWSTFDGLYFYNPFSEQLFESSIGASFAIDDTIDLHRDNFDRYIAATLDRLAGLRNDTRVVTYHGLGADLPSGYELVSEDRIGTDSVQLWCQTRRRTTRRYNGVDART
jgi:SAM-dependent methyltransferase